MGLSWDLGSDGNSPIIDFRINIAELNGSFSVLDTTTDSSYIATSLTAGVTYELKIEARNQFGYSTYSDTIQLLCAFIPETPTTVETSIEGS